MVIILRIPHLGIVLIIITPIILSSIPVTTINELNTQRYHISTNNVLHQKYRPVFGGIHIETLLASQNKSYVYGCTIGYTAWRNNVKGIITAGHCYYVNSELANDRRTYQPTISSANYIGKPSLIVYQYNPDPTNPVFGLDFAFIPYANSITYAAYVPQTNPNTINMIYLGNEANQYFIKAILENPEYEIVITGSNSLSHIGIAYSVLGCEDIPQCNIFNYTIIKIENEDESNAIVKGDSGGTAFLCYYNICDSGADALIIGIIVGRTEFRDNCYLVYVTNAFRIHQLYDIKPYPG